MPGRNWKIHLTTTQIGHEFSLQSSHGSLHVHCTYLDRFIQFNRDADVCFRCFRLKVWNKILLKRKRILSWDDSFIHSTFSIQICNLSANQFTLISLFVFQAALGSALRAPARCSQTVRSTGAESPPGSGTRWTLRWDERCSAFIWIPPSAIWPPLSVYLGRKSQSSINISFRQPLLPSEHTILG